MAKQTDCWWFHDQNFYRNSTSIRCFRCCQALLDRLNQCLISGTVGFLCQRVLTDCCRGEPSRYPAWPQCQLEPQPMDHGARWCLVPGGATRRRSWEFSLASFVLAIGPDFFCWALLRSRVVQLCLCTCFIVLCAPLFWFQIIYETDINWQDQTQQVLQYSKKQRRILPDSDITPAVAAPYGAKHYTEPEPDFTVHRGLTWTDCAFLCMLVSDLKSLLKEKVITPPAPWWFYCHSCFAWFCPDICRVSQELSHGERPEGTLLLCFDLCVGLCWFSALKLWK